MCARTNEVLEPITFDLVYRTVFQAHKASDSGCTDVNLCQEMSVSDKCTVMLLGFVGKNTVRIVCCMHVVAILQVSYMPDDTFKFSFLHGN